MTITLLAALTRDRVIAHRGKIPWNLPEDLAQFKRITTGHCVLMGRRTYEAFGKPLPGRRNVVLAHAPIAGVETYSSLESAFDVLQKEKEVFVIGGGEVYNQVIGHADRLRLTLVQGEFEGDVFFPPYEHLIGTAFTLRNRQKFTGFEVLDLVRTA